GGLDLVTGDLDLGFRGAEDRADGDAGGDRDAGETAFRARRRRGGSGGEVRQALVLWRRGDGRLAHLAPGGRARVGRGGGDARCGGSAESIPSPSRGKALVLIRVLQPSA